MESLLNNNNNIIMNKRPFTVNWLLFVMYQFSSVPVVDKYKYTCTIDCIKPII